MIRRFMAYANSFRKRMGVDHAIAYTFAARACMIVGSTGTVLLIVRFLSNIQQGYYYTLLSLVNLQIIFELGFSFIVLQLAAHEAVHLHFHRDGRVDGDRLRHDRLVAILQKTVRWYLLAGAVIGVTLLPAGILFFYRTAPGESSTWLGPWTAAAFFTVILFVVNPFCSFLEGCGQVRQVAAMRLGQAGLAVLAAWSCMLSGKGLYAPAMVNLGCVVAAAIFLWRRRNLFRELLRHQARTDVVSWRAEVWSFQWKIAITWLCSYFAVQVLTPTLFAFRGAAEAGRLGMSVNIAAYMWNLVFAWMSTKAAPFGQLISRNNYAALDQLFFRTLRQSLAVLVVLILGCLAAILSIQVLFPGFAARMVSPPLFVLLLLAAVSTLIVQSEAIYLRAHKEEPLLWQAVTVAAMTSAGAYLVAPRYGVAGVCIVYFICTGVIGVVSASMIFHAKRQARNRQFRAAAEIQFEAVS